MAKYRLLAQHFSEEDKLLEPGTEVGDGCEHAWTRPPTVEMEALDDEGRVELERERQRAGEQIEPLDELPMTMADSDQAPAPRRHRRREPEPEPEAEPPPAA